jgi:hypothetical protein
VARGSPERPERRPGGSRRGARDAEQAERRFLRVLAAKLGSLTPIRGPDTVLQGSHAIQAPNFERSETYRMLRFAIGRALLWFLLPAVERKWRSDGQYLRQLAEFGDAMLAKAAEGAARAAEGREKGACWLR